MGGLFILLTTFITALLWCNLTKPEVWIFLACLLGFAVIGFWDDWCKIRFRKGILESHKFRAQLAVALLVALSWYFLVEPPTENLCPLCKMFIFIRTLPYSLAASILIGTSNAVNLTDGSMALLSALCSLILERLLLSAFLRVTIHLPIIYIFPLLRQARLPSLVGP